MRNARFVRKVRCCFKELVSQTTDSRYAGDAMEMRVHVHSLLMANGPRALYSTAAKLWQRPAVSGNLAE